MVSRKTRHGLGSLHRAVVFFFLGPESHSKLTPERAPIAIGQARPVAFFVCQLQSLPLLLAPASLILFWRYIDGGQLI
jgi:hypothetical protein